MPLRIQFLLCAAICLSAVGVARGNDLIAQESFSYGSSPNLQGANGGTGWSTSWAKLSVIPTGVANQGLQFPALASSGLSAFTAAYPSPDFTRYSRAISTYVDEDNTVYVSFLIRPNIGYGVTGGLAFGTYENGMVVGACPSSTFGLITPNSSDTSVSTVPVVQDEPALLVARISLNATPTTTWSLFVNPKIGQAEPETASASLTVPIGSLPQALSIYNDGGYSTDEIRVGHTWASVVPSAAVPGDVTGNGVVNVDDLLAVINNWGVCGSPCPADATGNGVVDVDDLLVVINNWS